MSFFYKIIIFILILIFIYFYFGKKEEYKCLGYNITPEKMEYLKENSPYVYKLLQPNYNIKPCKESGKEEIICEDFEKAEICDKQQNYEKTEPTEEQPLIPGIDMCDVNEDEDEEKGEEKKKKWKMEEKCRKIFETIYKDKFPKCRPDFLRNPETNRKLELDGYCPNKKIAFEYNGAQHYIYPNIYHHNLVDFQNGLKRDKFKVERCDQNDVYLITIPYNVPESLLLKFITWFLPENADKRIELENKGKIPHYVKFFYEG